MTLRAPMYDAALCPEIAQCCEKKIYKLGRKNTEISGYSAVSGCCGLAFVDVARGCGCGSGFIRYCAPLFSSTGECEVVRMSFDG